MRGVGGGGERNQTPCLYKTQEYSSNKSMVLNVRGQRLKLLECRIRDAYFTTQSVRLPENTTKSMANLKLRDDRCNAHNRDVSRTHQELHRRRTAAS